MNTRPISAWTTTSTLAGLLALGFSAGGGAAQAAPVSGSMEARLQAVEDRQAIEELMSQPRASAPGAPPPSAPPAGEFGATKHVVTNLNLKLNGDTSTAYWQTIAIRPGGATAIAGVGHYIDPLK